MKARLNPFASRRLHQIEFRLRGTSWDRLFDRLDALRYRAAVVGPHGSGKTTLVQTLEPELERRGFILKKLRLSEDNPSFPGPFLRDFFQHLQQGDLVLLDGAEQMNRLAWTRFRWRCRVAGGLLITTHRPGRLPLLYRCETDLDLLLDLLDELMGEPLGWAMREEASRLFSLHEGNIREVLRDFYDHFSGNWHSAFEI